MQQLSLFRGVHDTQPRPVTLEELVTMMRTDQSVRDLTEKHRYARSTGDEQGASRYKKMMTSFGVAARFEGGRQQKHIVELTGLSLVDIDHIAPERMTEILEKVREDEHTLLAYTTLSGQGLRILFQYQINENVKVLGQAKCFAIDENSYPLPLRGLPLKEGECKHRVRSNSKELSPFKGDECSGARRNETEGVKQHAEQYKQVFEQGNKYYSTLTGLPTDGQCKNVGRISTIAYDENLYYNPTATPFIIKLEEKKPVGRPKGGKSEKGSVKRCKVGDVERLVQRELERRGIVYEAGTYNKYVSAFCYEMNRYGVPEEECREWAVNRFDDYNTPEVEAIVRSCYTQTEEHGTVRVPQNKSEKQATVAQIEAFLAGRVQLRRNVVTGFVEVRETETPSNLPLYGEALQASRTNYSKRTLIGECRAVEPSSSHRGEVRRGLLLLMECKAPDGRYLVTRKVHWQAVYRVLVDEGWYDASLGYAGFVDYIRSVAPPGGFRIMPDVETIRHISQTLYARPFRDWRYDAAYGTKRWAYERIRAVAETLLGLMGEMVNETVRNGYLDEPT